MKSKAEQLHKWNDRRYGAMRMVEMKLISNWKISVWIMSAYRAINRKCISPYYQIIVVVALRRKEFDLYPFSRALSWMCSCTRLIELTRHNARAVELHKLYMYTAVPKNNKEKPVGVVAFHASNTMGNSSWEFLLEFFSN